MPGTCWLIFIGFYHIDFWAEYEGSGLSYPLVRMSVFQAWTNKQRVLILGSRGIGHRDRHLMDDLRDLMPHCRRESKVRSVIVLYTKFSLLTYPHELEVLDS